MDCVIKSVGVYVGPNRIDNNYFSEVLKLETSNQWIVERTGIKERGFSPKTVAEMAILAAMECNIEKSKVKVVIVATSTNERSFPSAAVSVHRALGLEHDVCAFDISDACNGFIQAFSIAMELIKNTENHALVIGADRMSQILDWQDRSTCILFGDGAGAVVLNSKKDALFATSSYTLSEFSEELVANPKVSMNGPLVFRYATDWFYRDIEGILAKHSLMHDQVDWFIPHQANSRIIDSVKKRCNFKNTVNVVEYLANTSAASIPIALHSVKHKIKPGQIILMSGFGAGFRGGSALFTL